MIVASASYSPTKIIKDPQENANWKGGDVVPLGALSDILFFEYKHLCEAATPPIDAKGLRYIFRSQIVNQATKDIIFTALGKRNVDRGPLPWPGTVFTFPSDEAAALLGTANGNGAAWMAFSHRADIGWKTIKVCRALQTRNTFNIS